MNQLQRNFESLKKSLKVQSKKEFQSIDNSNEIIEKSINRLYRNHVKLNSKKSKPITKSSIYQQYYSKLRSYVNKELGKGITWKLTKIPKNPSTSIVKINSKKVSSYNQLLDIMSSEKLKNNLEIDIEAIKKEVKVFLTELKEKSMKWFLFFLIKLNIGLDYSDIAKLRISNFEVYLNRLVYKTERNKTEVQTTSFLSEKTINYFLKYVKELSETYGNDTNFNLFNSDNNSIDKIQVINSNSVRNTVKKLVSNYIHSKDLRSLTKHLITENSGLDVVKKEVLSQIWLGHKSEISKQYITELRNGNFVYNLYIENLERHFDDIIP